tara:strand:+ start:930 stop:1742 length:813 start_codon:yes stop_codon:yes gene_type:complete
MKTLLNNNDLNEALKNISDLGFIPTMGSLHKGHISLIKKSLKECKKTIVSIFVNPNQFDNKNDFRKYPRNNRRDLRILKSLNVHFAYLPNIRDIYNSKRSIQIKLLKKDRILCAKFRKGHFEGVIDIMDRLTKIVSPNKIYMGEKDFQQLHLVKKYIQKRYKSKIISCKTVRNSNKLALSSRNILLKKKDQVIAEKVIKSLLNFKKNLHKKKNLDKIIISKKNELEKLFNISVEYLELRKIKSLNKSNNTYNSKIFIAFYINKIRLIDNF